MLGILICGIGNLSVRQYIEISLPCVRAEFNIILSYVDVIYFPNRVLRSNFNANRHIFVNVCVLHIVSIWTLIICES